MNVVTTATSIHNRITGLMHPDNTEAPVCRPGDGRKYFSFSQYVKFGLCGVMNTGHFNSVKQPRGEVRRCEADGTNLRVYMMVGAGKLDEDLWEVYMACPTCGALYMEIGPVLGDSAD